MPTTYAHDAFGRDVYKKLSPEIRRVIRENGEIFRIGLHGPDILFYNIFNSEVTSEGVRMHHERARAFFEGGMAKLRRHSDDMLLSYMLGFACHYILDSSCHPYINEIAKKGLISHTLSEKEFDRFLMIKNGLDPQTYYPGDVLKPRLKYLIEIHRVIPSINVWSLHQTITMQRRTTHLFVYGKYGLVRRVINGIGSLMPLEKRLEYVDYFMKKYPDPKADPYLPEIEKLYNRALKEAPALLEELFNLQFHEKPLSERYDHTYNG